MKTEHQAQALLTKYTIKNIKRIRNKRGQLLSMVSLIPLAACGGGGSSPAPTTTPPPLGPDYTENPTGTFTGRDNANLTLAQGSATTDLTVNSKDGNDTITTGSGHDVINGAGGNDTIDAGNGNNTVTGGTGSDTISTGDGNDTIDAGDGDNVITDSAGDNTITAGGGSNTITTMDGNDTITTGAGNDTINAGLGNNIISAGAGDDVITTESGDDTITVSGGSNSITTGAGNDIIIGGTGVDTITSGDGDDIIRAGLGADMVDAGTGNDIIVIVGTTNAADYVEGDITNPGGSGLDVSSVLSLAELNGHASSDAEVGETIDGGTGTDTLMIYGTVDLTGVTVLNIENIQVNSTLTLTATQLTQFTSISGDGSSILNVVNDTGADPLVIDLSSTSLADIATLNTTGNVQIIVSSPDDLAGIVNLVTDSKVTLVLADDGTGTNTINLSDLAAVIGSVAAIEVEPTVTLVFDDTTSIVDTTITTVGSDGASEFDDTLYGTSGNDVIYGGDGNDVIYGLDGDDRLYGDDGNNILHGGNGRDSFAIGLVNSGGDDIYTGGADSDRFVVYPNAGNDIITDFNTTEDFLDLRRVDGIESDNLGTDTADGALFDFGNGNSILFQGQTVDSILNSGSVSLPTVMGTSGDDILILSDNNSGAVFVSAGRGNDTVTTGTMVSGYIRIFGGDGDDIITGGDSFDWINGGRGSDIMDGGNGLDNDILRYLYDSEGITANLTTGIITNASGDIDTVSNFEQIDATAYDDVITAGGGANPDIQTIQAGDGNNTITVTSGAVTIRSGSGEDSITTAEGDDLINAGSGDDTIIAGGGSDGLAGDKGDDTLTGGGGADVFWFGDTWGVDTITDFEDALDMLDFSASTLTFADLTITQSGADTLVEDGLGNSITLTGITSTDITVDDFIF